LAGIETNELFYERNVAPNPLTGDLANINFFVRNHQKDFEINVYDAIGNLVKTIYRGELLAGKQIAHWDASNNQGEKVANGMYYFTMRSGNNMVTDKIIVNR
jgi:flagellar hook assembly protein FlgD